MTDLGTTGSDAEQSSRRWPGVISVILATGLGAAFGIFAKRADGPDFLGAGQITSLLGVWVLLVAIIGFCSATVVRATVCSALFVLAALFTYYAQQWQQFGYVPQQAATAWCVLAMTGVPALAAVGHQVRRPGWAAALAIGLPMSLLIAEGLPRLISAPVIQPYVWVDIMGFVLLAIFGLVKRVSVWRLAVVVAVAAAVATALLDAAWSALGGLG
jgi:hypothetical protein